MVMVASRLEAGRVDQMIDKEIAEFAVNELEKAIKQAYKWPTEINAMYVGRLKKELVEVIMTGSYQTYASNRIDK